MTDTIQQAAFTRAIRTLDALGAQYAVIYDGQTYGTLALAPPPKLRKDGRAYYKRGTTRAHYWPYVENLKVGEAVSIPYADFDPHVLAGNISAACCHAWGAQTHITQRDDVHGVIEVLRIA